MKLKYLPEGKLLIKVEKETKSKSGVFYAEDNISREVGVVLQAADDAVAKKGERVLFKTWALNNYKVGDDEFSILDEKYVDGVL